MYSKLTPEAENWLNRLPPVQPMNRTIHVFIYGIGRSGTSIVSRILSAHPSAIYFHEPFLPKIKLSGVQWEHPHLDIYERLYNCNFSGIIPDLPMYHWKNSVPFSVWPYVEFLFGMKLAPMVTPVVFSRLVRNEAFMEKHCSKYSIRVIKEPDRMPIEDLSPLLNDFPDLKVIHVWRNPVDLFRARSDEVWCCGSCKNITHLCKTTEDMLGRSFEFSKSFPNRYINVHFDDILRNPREVIDALISHLEIPPHQSIEDFAEKMLRRNIPPASTSDLPPLCQNAAERLEWHRRNTTLV
ncbi:unnamed protein product [Darwinula stevensoni]|uniref:Sulfotransferase n=1 Tax=Darwinula stevensoni TaxID=69355 RepID=A0A7R9ABE0_9CRUS|nr:unnamed protein product [Darwinula stevensoni]CAG0899315.1 unnamed protein product [Darwinula stevensoni]